MKKRALRFTGLIEIQVLYSHKLIKIKALYCIVYLSKDASNS